MTPEQWQLAKKILEEAIEARSTAEVTLLLDERCPDAELRKQLDEMIAFYKDGYNSTFLEKPAMEVEAEYEVKQHMQLIGLSIGRFEISSLLGVGAMGVVYRARDTSLGREVALKVLPSTFLSNRQLKQFENEAHAASSLNHPNIVTVHEVGQSDSIHYIVTELIHGETLRERISRGGLSKLEIMNIAIDVAKALAAAHANGIVHRDIKPENVMLTSDGYIKVLDFGLAHFTQEIYNDMNMDPQQFDWKTESTNYALPIGTIKYMSPERFLSNSAYEQTDIWSLGVILYEMVCGRAPFEWQSKEDVQEMINHNRMGVSVPEYYGELQQIIKKALCLDKENRYRTIAEMLEDMLLELKNLRLKQDNEISIESMKLFVGRNYSYYSDAWGSYKLNFPAVLFFPIWAGYRKMYTLVLISIPFFIIFGAILAYFEALEVWRHVQYGAFMGFSIFANMLYRKHVERKIVEINALGLRQDEKIREIKRKGGTNIFGAVLGIVYMGALTLAFVGPDLPPIIFRDHSKEIETLENQIKEILPIVVDLEIKQEAAPKFRDQINDPLNFPAFADIRRILSKQMVVNFDQLVDKSARVEILVSKTAGNTPAYYTVRTRLFRLKARIAHILLQCAEKMSTSSPPTAEIVKAEELETEMQIGPLEEESNKLFQILKALKDLED